MPFHIKKVARYGIIYPFIAIIIIGTLIASTVYWGLGSESGRLWLSQTALSKVNQLSPWQIHVTNLRSPELNTWHIDKLSIHHNDEPVITANNISFQWEPEWLLQKKVGVRQMSSDTLDVYLPLPKTSSNKSKSNTSLALDKLPDIFLDDLRIAQLSVHQKAPNALHSIHRYTLAANGKIVKNEVPHINITAHALDESKLTVAIRSEINNPYDKTPSVIISGTLSEAENGLIGQALRLPATQKINAEFKGILQQDENILAIDLTHLTFNLTSPKTKKNHTLAVSSKGHINLQTLDAQIFDSTLHVDNVLQTFRGEWKDKRITAALNTHELPLDMLSIWVPKLTTGEISGHINFQGSAQDYSWDAVLNTTTEYNNLPIKADFSGNGNNQIINIKAFNLQQNTASLGINGHVSTQGLRNINTTNDHSNSHPNEAHTSQKPIENTLAISLKNMTSTLFLKLPIPIPEALNKALTDQTLSFNRIDVDANLQGELRDPDGNVKIYALALYEKVPLTLSSYALKKSQRIDIKSLNVAAKNNAQITTSTADGNINLTSKKADITADINKFPLQLLRIAGLNIPEKLRANVNLKTRIKGTLTAKDIHKAVIQGDLTAAGEFQDIPFMLTATGQHNNKLSQIKNLSLYTYDQLTVSIDGEFNQQQNDDSLAAKIIIDKLPPQLTKALKLPLSQGDFSTNLDIGGSTHQPTVKGELSYSTSFKSIDKNGEEKDFVYKWLSDIQTKNNQLLIDSSIYRDELNSGSVSLSAPIKTYMDYVYADKSTDTPPQNIPLDAEISGSFNLNTLGFFIDSDLHQFRGDASTDIIIKGNMNEPQIHGDFKIKKGTYDNALTGTSVHNVDCTILATQNNFTIDSCTANDSGKGKLQLTGEVTLPATEETGKIDLIVTTDHASILRRPDIESEVTGEISIAGDFKDLAAKGHLDVSPFTAIIDSPTNANIPSIKVTEVYDEEKNNKTANENVNYLPNITFDLAIAADQQAFIRGRGLDAELQGDLRITGTGKKPKYTGQFETKRGSFEIFNKKFNLEKGEVTLANDAITLLIVGEYEKNSSNIIRAELSGVTDNLKIELTSTPTMAEDEILAFLIFGKSILKITPFEAIRLAMAVQSLSSSSASLDPISKTRDFLGVDTLSVDSGEDDDGNSGLNLGVGKYINEKVYLELQHTPDPTQPWKGNVQIELSPSLSVESSTGGTSGIEGAELKWKRDY